MAGVKGRSGRKPLCMEVKKHHIIWKAWNRVDKKLDAPMMDRDANQIAASLAVKDMVGKESVVMDATITQQEKDILTKLMPANRIADIQ